MSVYAVLVIGVLLFAGVFVIAVAACSAVIRRQLEQVDGGRR